MRGISNPEIIFPLIKKLGVELTYEVRIKDDNTGFVNKISACEGVTNAVLVSYNGEYMS